MRGPRLPPPAGKDFPRALSFFWMWKRVAVSLTDTMGTCVPGRSPCKRNDSVREFILRGLPWTRGRELPSFPQTIFARTLEYLTRCIGCSTTAARRHLDAAFL